MIEQEFAAGHVFFRCGDAADVAYHLHDGQVEFITEESGKLSRVGSSAPGQVFGEMALLTERPRAFTARAATAGRASVLSRGEFERQLTHVPDQAQAFLWAMLERLRALTSHCGSSSEHIVSGLALSSIQAGDHNTEAPVELPGDFGTTSPWYVVIHPLTRRAAATLPEEGLRISHFPIRMGRATGPEESEASDLNDLWLLDEAPYHVSRNHCEILSDARGLIVRDRGSYLGCIVNDEPIGGRAVMGYARLEPGDNVLVVGSAMSKYQFRLTVVPQVVDTQSGLATASE